MRKISVIISLFCIFLPKALYAATANNAPSEPLKQTQIYKHLTSAERQSLLPSDTIIESLGIKPGMTILDLGCGVGNFTFPLADALKGTGKVFATDIKPQMVSYVKELAEKGKYKNVFPVLVKAGGVDPFYKNKAFDIIFFCGTYTLIWNPEDYFRDLRPSLARGTGRLYIIQPAELSDFQEDDFEGFEKVIEILKAKGRDFPVFKRLGKENQDFIRNYKGGNIPAQIKTNIIRDFDKMLRDRFFFNDLMDYYFSQNLVEENMHWIKLLLHTADMSEVGLTEWLLVRLDEAGVFNKRAKTLTDIEKEELKKFNKILLLRIFGLTKTSVAKWDFRSMTNMSKKGIISKLESAGYKFVKERNSLPQFYFLEFKRDN